MQSDFKEALKRAALTQMHNPRADEWKALIPLITQNILTDAHQQSALAEALFSPTVGKLESRPLKTLDRVVCKMEASKEHFKAVSDFIAFRVHCEVEQIQTRLDAIMSVVEIGSYCFTGSYASAASAARKRYTDIVKYLYVYIPVIGYVVEFQVGHPFASYTFTVDSALRDDPACGLIDMWTDGAYDVVKKYILAVANRDFIQGNAPYNMWDCVVRIHRGNVPAELKAILNRIR